VDTDANRFAWTPHGTYRDLELFVNLLGFTPMEAILSATALGGEIMLHPHELGKVQTGYYADLILVNGNPLDDITVLSGPKNIDLVMIVSPIESSHDDKLKPRTAGSIKSACKGKRLTALQTDLWWIRLETCS